MPFTEQITGIDDPKLPSLLALCCCQHSSGSSASSSTSSSSDNNLVPFCCGCQRFNGDNTFPDTMTASLSASCFNGQVLTIQLCSAASIIAHRCTSLEDLSLFACTSGVGCRERGFGCKKEYIGNQQAGLYDGMTTGCSCFVPPGCFSTFGDYQWAFFCRLVCFACGDADRWYVQFEAHVSQIPSIRFPPFERHYFFSRRPMQIASCDPFMLVLNEGIGCQQGVNNFGSTFCLNCQTLIDCDRQSNVGPFQGTCCDPIAYGDLFCNGGSYSLVITENL